jgi:hypothetical protein
MRLKKKYSSSLIIFTLILNTIFLIKLSFNPIQIETNKFALNITLNDTNGIEVKNFLSDTKQNKNNYNVFINSTRSLRPKVNEFNYEYILRPNESFCETGNNNSLLLIAFVPISPKNFKQRNTIRSTWANHQLIKNFRVVFMIGQSSEKEVNSAIRHESKLNGDIVQNNFTDAYFNLTTKTIMGFRWVSTYCSNAKYTLKVDDDVVVNINRLLKYLTNISTSDSFQTNKIMCSYYKHGAPVIRVNTSKFYLSKEEHPQDFFVPYCDGPSYMLTTDLTKKMYELSFYTKQFKFEDVYMGVNKCFNIP